MEKEKKLVSGPLVTFHWFCFVLRSLCVPVSFLYWITWIQASSLFLSFLVVCGLSVVIVVCQCILWWLYYKFYFTEKRFYLLTTVILGWEILYYSILLTNYFCSYFGITFFLLPFMVYFVTNLLIAFYITDSLVCYKIEMKVDDWAGDINYIESFFLLIKKLINSL